MKIAVVSRSFSKNVTLRKELQSRYASAEITFNNEEKVLAGDELVHFLKDATLAITGLEVIDTSLLKACPKLKHISKYGVGLDMLNLEDMKNAGVTLGWTPGVNKRAVSELTLSFMLLLLRNSHVSYQNLLQKNWIRTPGTQLSEKTVGIIGCGNVGKDLVELLKPFRCKILAYDIKEYDEFYTKHAIQSTSLNELLRESDIVTLHVPKNPQTKNMIGKSQLELMKRSAALINTARGGLVDENALYDALKSDRIAGAAFDVFETEPLKDFRLFDLPNFYGTPHIGGNSFEAVLAMGNAAIENLENKALATQYIEFI